MLKSRLKQGEDIFRIVWIFFFFFLFKGFFSQLPHRGESLKECCCSSFYFFFFPFGCFSIRLWVGGGMAPLAPYLSFRASYWIVDVGRAVTVWSWALYLLHHYTREA